MSFLICNCRIGYQIPMFAGFCIMFLSTISEYIQFLVLFLTSISHLSAFMKRVGKMPYRFMQCMILNPVSYISIINLLFLFLLCVKCLRFPRAICCCFWPDLYKVSALHVLLWQVTDSVQRYIRFQKDAVKSYNLSYDTLFTAQFVNLSALNCI